MTAPTYASLRNLEKASIRAFVEANAHLLTGRVLDFGSGLQPYRSIVEGAGGEYVPYDRFEFPGSVVGTDVGPDDPLAWGVTRDAWDAILVTQVIQYVPDTLSLLETFGSALVRGGSLVLTGPTNWPVIEADDLFRFTAAGMRKLLVEAGFDEVSVRVRASVFVEGEEWPIGWGAVARA